MKEGVCGEDRKTAKDMTREERRDGQTVKGEDEGRHGTEVDASGLSNILGLSSTQAGGWWCGSSRPCPT